MPTDEKFIEFLWNIKEHCTFIRDKHEGCKNCRFFQLGKAPLCQFRMLADRLSESTPKYWDMEEIERVIRL